MTTSRDIARTIATRCTALRVRSAARTLTRAYDEELRTIGLRMSQLTVLVGVAMFGDDGAPISALAAAIVMDRTTLTRNLRPLLDQGLLRSVPDREDRRSRRIELAKKGEQMLARAFPLWQRAQTAIDASLGSQGRVLRASLDDVLVRMAHVPVGDDEP